MHCKFFSLYKQYCIYEKRIFILKSQYIIRKIIMYLSHCTIFIRLYLNLSKFLFVSTFKRNMLRGAKEIKFNLLTHLRQTSYGKSYVAQEFRISNTFLFWKCFIYETYQNLFKKFSISFFK